jgi:hypothetical protein
VPRVEPFRPEIIARLAAQRIVGTFGLGREADHFPVLPVAATDRPALAGVVDRQDRAGQILFVPAGLDDDDRAARLQAGFHIVVEGIDGAAADHIGFRFLPALHRIIDNHEIGTVAGDPRQNSARHVLGAVLERPFVRGAALGAEFGAEERLVLRLLDDRPRAPTQLAAEIAAVARADHSEPRPLAQSP